MAASLLGDLADFRAIFFEEADEHLASIESLLLQAEKSSLTSDHLNEIFRAAHSIKGSSGMLDFGEMVSLTHVLENLLDLLRKGERAPTQRDIEAMLRAGDLVRLQLAHRRGTAASAPDADAADAVEAELRALAAGEPGSGAPRQFTVRLGPLAAPVEPGELEMLMAGLGDLGSISGEQINNTAGGDISFDMAMAGMEADLISILSLVVAPELVQVKRTDAAAPGAVQAAAAGHTSGTPAGTPADTAANEAAGHASDTGALPPSATAGDEIFVDPRKFKKSKARAMPLPDDHGGELFVHPDDWKTARAAARAKRRTPGRRQSDYEEVPVEKVGRRDADALAPGATAEGASIRVSVEKIDRLVNLAGEMVITEAMLARSLAQLDLGNSAHGDNLPGLADLARHTRNLQDAVMSVRMVPIAAVFARFPRLVRELSQRLGKQVEVRMSGEATELDRGLIEKITDPLTHLVRNSIDHGLETPEQRQAAGKGPAGTITLAASQRASNIVIEVRDDGRGLDRARILARAAERGITIAPDAPDRQVWQMIFEPGFSTAETVTDVSGRGVGMDVVRRNIQSLGGSVELSSHSGGGTIVTLSVPLTLAIMEAMTVGSCGDIYVLPLTAVIESRRLAEGDVHDLAGRGQTLRVRDDHLPVLRLTELFPPRADAPPASGGIALIVETEAGRAAIIVDELVGQQQVVVKSLEANFRRVPGLAGATIMGDGKVALILDMGYVVRFASNRGHA